MPNKESHKNIFEGAVSANPNFVTEFLNPNGSLEKKTSVVVIYFDKRTYDIYRESTGKPGWSSRVCIGRSSNVFRAKSAGF